MTTIKRCTNPGQAGRLALRTALWPAESSEHLADMQDFCAQPGRYARFVAYSEAGEEGCSEMNSETLLDNKASQDMHLALGFEETERVVYFRKPALNEKKDGKPCD